MAERKFWPNGPRIKELMLEKEWDTAEKFETALKAAIGRRTIQLIIKGDTKHPEGTLQKIANALGVDLNEITFKENPSPEMNGRQAISGNKVKSEAQDRTINVHFHFPISIKDFDERKITRAIKLLKKLIDSKGNVNMTDLREGSTILTLAMTEEDVFRLLAALEARRPAILSKMGATNISIDWNIKELLDNNPMKRALYQNFLMQQRKIAAKEEATRKVIRTAFGVIKEYWYFVVLTIVAWLISSTVATAMIIIGAGLLSYVIVQAIRYWLE